MYVRFPERELLIMTGREGRQEGNRNCIDSPPFLMWGLPSVARVVQLKRHLDGCSCPASIPFQGDPWPETVATTSA